MTGERLIRRHLVVEGRVQGVWYRDTCREMARRVGVSGWVRNLDSGDVEAVFEGEASAVEWLVAWARRGPDRALVTRVQLLDEPPKGEVGFRVR